MKSSARAQLGAFSVLLAAIGLSSCGGGGGTSNTPAPTPTGSPPAAVLVVGATYQYTGTESLAIVYANPSATAVNSNAAYTYVANQTINAGASGAPAPFDVHRATTYTVTTAPSSGELLLATTADTYESQTFSGATETIATAGTTTVTTGTDLNAALRLGGGPFNESLTSTTAFNTAATDAVYPLITGAAFTEPLARTVNTVTTDATAGGTSGGGGTTAITYNNDGSYTRTFSAADGSSQQQSSVVSAGTGQLAVTTATNSTTTVIGLPSGSGGPLTIPVTVTNNAGVTNDFATDWYPGGGQPTQPLALTTHTVVGPASLPTACAYTGTVTALIETTVTTSNLDPVGGTSTASTEQLYNANGTNICRTQTTTTTSYIVTTGALNATTTTTITEVLAASNQTILGLKRRVVR